MLIPPVLLLTGWTVLLYYKGPFFWRGNCVGVITFKLVLTRWKLGLEILWLKALYLILRLDGPLRKIKYKPHIK
ncbi:hypothetical protein OC25_02330 [Pedobacter kyungheensis]|uniref:Uncharacterized protein n=1 Tax=Pedobacter kyungheensis TaxID=1069985 RepID=A0A0C1G913_9SPHI|nr:hypothetical protein OC25_02330 [Pedobacter kyungheensis]